MPEETKKVICPNCYGPAIKEGNKIVCETCDATFTFTKTGAAKVQDIGRLNALEKRVDRLDSLLPGQEPESKEPGEPEEPSILGDD